MWTTEYSIETTVAPAAIWRAWADISRWPEWNSDIQHVALTGPFTVGSTITMTPLDQEPVRLEASGPEADLIGAAVSADFGETLTALVEHAGR